MTDIEIASQKELIPIERIAAKIGIKKSELELYGKYKAKILKEPTGKKRGKLILVTSINPTPYGEGKTTMSIGIHDALCKIGKKSIVALREPSLGPVFGTKGGATGGGLAQVVPMADINLHFTGDIHAITTTNNLLCAAIDNHLFQGNELNLNPEKLCFPRAMDMNDRSLRDITVGKGKTNFERNDYFVITVASEVMAILCLAKDMDDLKTRLGKIIIGYTFDDNPVYAKDLQIVGALAILLKDAIKPNLVQTLEGNPAIIHGGPFANIAHGCNSIIATNTALSLADYVVTEAGFGSDLGAEKFLDIKCNIGNLKPDAIVVNATIRSLKYNGGCDKDELTVENIDYLNKGLCNLEVHVTNMQQYSNHIIVCLNKFHTDTNKEIDIVRKFVQQFKCEFEVSEAHAKGGEGAANLAEKIVAMCKEKTSFTPLYNLEDSIANKISTITTKIYHANEVIYSDEANAAIKKIEEMGYSNLPICIAKTQYSISDDPKKLGFPKDFAVNVRDVKLCLGAGFIVVYMGNIMTMPGLSKTPAYENMEIDNQYKIKGLF